MDATLPWLRCRAATWLARFPDRLFAGTAADGVVAFAEALGLINAHPAALDAAIADLLAPPPADPPSGGPLARAFGLDDASLHLLLAAAAPALSVEAGRLLRFLRAAGGPPDVGFLAELVGLPASAALAATADHAPLVRGGLVVPGAGSGLQRSLEVPDDVLLALAGAPIPHTTAAPAPWPAAAQGRLQAALARAPRRSSGWWASLAPVAGARWRPPGRSSSSPRPPSPLPASPRPARPSGGARLAGRRLAVILDDLDDEAGAALWAGWRPQAPCLCLGPRVDPALAAGARRVVHAPEATRDERLHAWQAALDADGRGWPPSLAARIGERFAPPPAALGLALADVDGEARVDALFGALRRRLDHGLDALAQPVTTPLGFDDLVLPPAVLATLHDVVAHGRHRDQVLHGWGFDRLLPYGRGLGCLFAGPPGTGKTMVAGILANALDREIYRVDTARLVSKWIGETEKNLARLFAAAVRARAILFFDEADSLFGKRTEVRGSNDRFANMEVNDLLQRMERFDGISILATNLHQSMDDAFRRRFRFIVHFEEPDASERARLWARMLPPGAPRAPALDFDALGRRFKLTGGHIKNAVVRAAYGAAAQGRVIDQALLTQAAQDEVHALGRL
ncbi:MAG: AAA family ATPase [Myxococcales bacterium]|nr:AAA family ATPase [Myxococcales bacterium]